MSFFSSMQTVAALRPAFNVGALLDIPTGAYHIGKDGESILNGGVVGISSVVGPANSFKSVIIMYINFALADRIKDFNLSIYDSEASLSYSRINQMIQRFPELSKIVHGNELLAPEDIKITLTSAVEMFGDEYFDKLKEILKERSKSKRSTLVETPFLNAKGENVKIQEPHGVVIDSLSEFKISVQDEKIIDKNKIGASGNNILYMREGIAKKQLVTQLPKLCGSNSLLVSLTAHIGDEFELDPYAPKKHKLTHAKRGSKVTGTTKAFEFLNNVVYEIFSSSPLNNKEKKTGVLYPVLASDRDEDCKDLMIVNMVSTRNKSGPSGFSVNLIVSQREGVLGHLSQFHYIKEQNRYGLIGNNTNYQLALLPEVTLSRTTVRGKVDEISNLRRALEITSEMLQLDTLWASLPDNLMCSPAELYSDLIAMGYDWEILLNTRGYWVLEKDAEGLLPFLSTMDLLRMRKSFYRPKWYPK